MVSHTPDASNLDYVPDLRLKGVLGGIDNVSVINDKAYTYTYTELGSRLSMLDISSPNNPVAIGHVDIKQGLIVDISLDADYVYLAVSTMISPRVDSLRIMDISDPTAPIELGTYRPSLSYYDVWGVAVLGNYAYLAGSSGLHIVNVSNPAMPQEVGVYNTSGSVSDIVVSGNYAYLVSDTTTIQIVNISNPSNPQYVGQYSTASINQLTVVGNKAYVATGNAGIKIVDISIPASPVLVGSYDEYAADVAVIGNRVYVASRNSVYVLDITNPAAPSKLGYVDVFNFSGKVGHIEVLGSYAFVSADGGLQVIRLADWPYIVSDYGLGSAFAVAVKGNYAYLSTGKEFRIVDVTNLANPVAMGRLPNIETSVGDVIEVVGNFAYLSGSQGFRVINISNPASPVEVYANPNLRWGDIAISDHYAYIANDSEGLQVLDLSTPSNPVQIVSYAMSARYISVSGTYAYITDSSNRLHVINISNPANPTHVSIYNMPQTPLDIYVSGSYAYIATGSDGLRIINISNPAMPLEVGSYTSMDTSRVFVSGNYAYLIGWYSLLVLDVSNPTTAVSVGSYFLPYGASSHLVVDSYAYLATKDRLLILRAAPSTTSAVSTEGGSLISELDNTSYNFPAGIFTNSVFVSHTPLTPRDVFLDGFIPSAGHIWEVRAVYTRNYDEPAEPVGPFTFTVTYTDQEVGAIDESTLALYYWDGVQWLEETSGVLDVTTNTIAATSTHFSQWMLAGTARYQMYLPILARNFSNPDLSIARLEITQAVQNPANTVPLVANRNTVVRIYAKTTGLQPVNDVYLSLTAFRNGVQLPDSPLVTGPWAVFTNPSPGRYAETYNVSLPTSWLSGQVVLSASVDSTNSIRETNETNNAATATVMFNEVPSLNIKIVPVNYTDTSSGVNCPAPAIDEISDWIMRSYPVSKVNISFRAPTNFTDVLDDSGTSRLLSHITSLKQADGAPASEVYYGLYQTENDAGDYCFSYWAGFGWIGQRAAIGSRSISYDQSPLVDSTGFTAAHEIGHNFGLWHAPCGGPSMIDPNFPYATASIGQYGYDVFRNYVLTPGGPDSVKDVMSYCSPNWFSDYNYLKLYNDQITHGVMQIQTGAQDTLMIRVTFNVDDTPVFHPVYIVPGFTGEAAMAGPYSIEVLDANGQVIASEPVTVFEAEEDSFTNKAIFANIQLPASPVASVRLVYAGEEIAKRTLTENSNMIDTTVPLEITQAEDGIVLRWGMDSIPAMVRYTTDEGQTWTAIGLDVLGGELYIDAEMMPLERGRIEVRLADNGTQSLASSSLSFDWSDFRP